MKKNYEQQRRKTWFHNHRVRDRGEVTTDMPSFFSIVQYVPDLVRKERINFGVVVFSEDESRSHFIKNWNRVLEFGGDIASLREVTERIGNMPLKALKNAIETWDQSIQFTEPAGSLLSVDSLLEDIAKRCLLDF